MVTSLTATARVCGRLLTAAGTGLGLAAVTLAVTGSPAYAAPSPVVWVDGTVLHFHYNDWPSGLELKIYPAGGAWIVDADVVLSTRSGCRTSDSGVTAICMGPVERVEARLGPGDDRLDLDPDALRPDVTDLVIGGDGKDTLLGGAGDSELIGGLGSDHLEGRGGSDTLAGDDLGLMDGGDTLVGGPGHDYASYVRHPHAIVASLDGVIGNDGAPGEGDTIAADIEELWGSCYDDVLYGNDGDNVIWGNAGADTIFGLGGDDRIRADGPCGDPSLPFWPDYVDGGPGSDTVLLLEDPRTQYIDLDDQLNDDGAKGENDSYIDMENIDSAASGAFTGNDEPNRIVGGNLAANVINGLGGDDELGGGWAGDIISGGDGDDVLIGDHPSRLPFAGHPGGADFLFGQIGDDHLDAGPNGMHVEGGSGKDTCVSTSTILTCEVIL